MPVWKGTQKFKNVEFLNGATFPNPSGGTDYHVDINAGSNTNDGKSWGKAFKTLAVALAASHANIAAGSTGWAARNRIFFKGDQTKDADGESLLLLAQKTDIIGVGSCDHLPTSRIIGNIAPVGNQMGCRFINVQFRAPAAGGIVIDIPTAQSGFALIDCVIDAGSTAPATIGVRITASEYASIIGCQFIGKFATAAITIGAGASNGLLIANNTIESAGIGIQVSETATCASRIGRILDNRIVATGLVIDDDSNKIFTAGNLGASGGSFGSTSHDVSDGLSVGNIITGSNITGTVPFATIA
jgi:hypothetical protein